MRGSKDGKTRWHVCGIWFRKMAFGVKRGHQWVKGSAPVRVYR